MKSRIFFAVCCLFAAAGTVGAQTAPEDHFLCHTTPTTTLQIPLLLQDQFDAAVSVFHFEFTPVETLYRLCNPVRKPVGNANGCDHLSD